MSRVGVIDWFMTRVLFKEDSFGFVEECFLVCSCGFGRL